MLSFHILSRVQMSNKIYLELLKTEWNQHAHSQQELRAKPPIPFQPLVPTGVSVLWKKYVVSKKMYLQDDIHSSIMYILGEVVNSLIIQF